MHIILEQFSNMRDAKWVRPPIIFCLKVLWWVKNSFCVIDAKPFLERRRVIWIEHHKTHRENKEWKCESTSKLEWMSMKPQLDMKASWTSAANVKSVEIDDWMERKKERKICET